MRKVPKIFSLVLALLLLFTAFTACQSNKDVSGPDASVDNTPAGTSKAPESSPPPAKEIPTIKWFQIGGQPKDLSAVTEKMNEYSAEKIGVKCEFTYLDWGVYGDRTKAILSSGEYFDILFNNADYYSSAVRNGSFADITDILNEAPELKAFVPEGVWLGAKIKGKIYGVPTYKDSSQTQYWVWDKELVEKYKIDYQNIRTLAQMDPVLHTIQDAIKKGEITDGRYAFFLKDEGVNGQFMNYDARVVHLGVRFDDKTAKVVRVLEQPDILENFKYLHKWYKEGLINPDAPTIKETPKWSPLGSGQGWPGADAIWGANAGKPVVSQPWGGPLYSTDTILGSINSVYSGSKYKTEAVKYLELCNVDPVMRNTLAYGIEGVHYTKNADGTITKDDVKKDDYGVAQYSQASFFTMWPQAPNPPDMWGKVKEWNAKAQNSVLLGFSFDREKVANEIAACEAAQAKYVNELFTGAASPEETIKKIYNDMEKAGLSKIQEELQTQVNAFLGK